MADNVTADPGTGGATFATDDDGTAHHPYVKVEWGADNTQTKVASGAAALPIQDGGNTITVDGTVTANAGTGPWPVTDNSGSLTVDNSTLSVVGGGLEATALRVTLASDSTGVVSVDDGGGALTVDGTVAVSGTVTVDGSGVTQPVSGTVTANLGATDNAVLDTIETNTDSLTVVGGGLEATALRVTIANDSTGVVSIDDNGGSVTVDGTVGISGTVTVDGSGVTQPVSAASLPLPTGASTSANQSTIIGHLDGVEGLLTTIDSDTSTLAVTGGGTETGALRVTIANNSTGVVSVDDNGGALTVDNGGTFAVQAAQSGTWTVQPGNTANTTPWLTTPTPATSGGLSIFRSIDLDESEEEVKGTAGQVFGMWVSNLATSTRFIKFYNATAANVTVGTTTPVITWAIPGNSTDDISAVFESTMGIAFGTAITVAATTGVADNDTGAPGANEVLVNIFYK